ncbi:sensor histidine kinase [Curtobacterium sp. VKM Ac-2884]|uniref:sensor histidine kinase n=1 Tax=Curtobacterium sp. VKM Ac-2884 TaxID=2783818 RepID=UPI00188D1B42|nr:HAMP domain-containing sensor histidine kinase [Curtobacterium sp. VKM Ac-2884]MBF4604006.1 HAMP domain-containing histidine kinase [Curtobacterium sp. VKM Ac-2884]
MSSTPWHRLIDATARWSLRRAPDRDADRLASQRSVIGIAVRVAAVSAALVVGIIALVVAYVLWQLTPGQQREQPGPFDVHITLDTLDLTVAIIGVGGLAIVFAGIASWLIARRAVRPLTEALRVQRTFVADASHELRTPLAVLHARVQRLRMQTPVDDPRRVIVDDVTSDTRILIDIVNDLLEAAAGTPSESGVARLEVGLSGLRRDMSVLADERQVRLYVIDHSASVGLTPTQLHRCLVALTDNAIGHTPPGGTVTVTTTPEHDRVCVRVQDDGSGISGIEPTRVFDRFAHGTGHGADSSGTRTGNGIGLALVREIVVRAGGDVTVESTGDHGTVFALRIPTVHAATSVPTITRRAGGR